MPQVVYMLHVLLTLLVTCGLGQLYQASARHNSEATTPDESQLHHHHVLNRHSPPLNQILNYTFTTPEMQLRKGVTHVGSNWRLRRALRRVVHHAGATLNIGAIGGSVTCGHGASHPEVGSCLLTLFTCLWTNAMHGAPFVSDFEGTCAPTMIVVACDVQV